MIHDLFLSEAVQLSRPDMIGDPSDTTLLRPTSVESYAIPLRPALHSLSHSGLFQAARASRKTFNLKGRNFRLGYTAKTGIDEEVHFGSTRMSLPLAMASSQYVEGNSPVPWPRCTNALAELMSRLATGPETWILTFLRPLTRSQSRSLFLALNITQSCDFRSAGSAGRVRAFRYSGAATR